MKKVAEFESELKVVEVKSKADIVAFLKLVLADLQLRENAFNNDPIIVDLSTKLEAVNAELLTAKEMIENKEVELTSLQSELETAKEVAKDALNKFNAQSTEAPKSNTIKIDGKDYVINHGVNFNGKDFTADDLAKDKKAVAELIEMNSSAVGLKEGK